MVPIKFFEDVLFQKSHCRYSPQRLNQPLSEAKSFDTVNCLNTYTLPNALPSESGSETVQRKVVRVLLPSYSVNKHLMTVASRARFGVVVCDGDVLVGYGNPPAISLDTRVAYVNDYRASVS